MDLNALIDFQLVATHGGFGRASRASGRSKATLSRRVADLEEQLGVRLIERGGQRLVLTEAGLALAERTAGPMHEVTDAFAAARDGVDTPRGLLRIAAPQLFSQLALGRLAAAFLRLHPEVEIETVSEDRRADLVEENFDVAIRINPPKDSGLVGRRFARDRLLLVAAPSFAQPSGGADEPSEVPAVVMAASYRDGDTWARRDGTLVLAPRPVLRLSSLLMVRDAVAAGAGVALLPQSIAGELIERGDVVDWGVAGDDVELWVLHTSRRLESPKVRAFVDFMASRYPGGEFALPAR
ncbi:LysR family transcriptional regulator [Luteibacter sp. 3190]|uniref:LysR family transcriptional regulator n=1 Tax=Luteibacter sp. 3190 TaxID=2817736 RepID=UPI002864ABF4|nr:LysR family transcriptional regulator [Luteibacter sp. 3190]MDR6936503.1 DNA-binding transcriptional LysR family regulator [Luteibacter sp. 3190]